MLIMSTCSKKKTWATKMVGSFVLMAVLWGTRCEGAFGDTVAEDFSCPAATTCPVVCAAALDDCLIKTCSANLQHCLDGSCRDDCSGVTDNPCGDCESGNLACPKMEVPDYEECLVYSEQFATLCQDKREEDYFNARPLSILVVFLVAVSVAVFGWCRFNHYPLATLPLEEEDEQNQTQTGYRVSAMGRCLYYAVVLTLTAIHGLLLTFCWASYHKNEEESLRAFEVTWSLGFVWTLLFKWPYSIESIFWKQCPLTEATRVCIFTPSSAATHTTTVSERHPTHQKLQRVLTTIVAIFSKCLSWIFATPGGRGKMQFVRVHIDSARGGHRYFVFQFRRFNFDEQSGTFAAGEWTVGRTIGDLVEAKSGGLSRDEVQRRLRIVGPNMIEAKPPRLLRCIVEQFSQPFYVYQTFMLWTWIPLYYYFLAIIHGSVIVIGGLSVSWFRYLNESNLYTLTHVGGTAEVLRDGQYETVEQAGLVPGDVIVVTPGIVYTDMVMAQTEGLLVDESALTGESAPVAKTAIDPLDGDKPYHPLVHKKHTISAGTTVLESELENNLAVVVSTGSYTAKGRLLREVFSYERHQFKFDVQVPMVMGILILESMAGFVLVWLMIKEQPVYAWFYGMYVVSTLLPPLLPTVFTVSVGISENRLAKKRIVCSKSEDILVAGKVTKAFFDKTGTLTRQGLDFISARCRDTWTVESMDFSDEMFACMACCHGLLRSSTGEIIGNHVDRTMFAASRAAFTGMLSNNVTSIIDGKANELTVVKQFDFDHHRMTQSVIVKRTDGSLAAFVKGSSESMQRICDPTSLPPDFQASVRDSSKSGTYQISMAQKNLPTNVDWNKVSRDELERDLMFVGLINFKNVLRPETPDVISHLEEGGVQCIMVTGDSVLTGITIAREAGLVKRDVALLVCTNISNNGEFLWFDESDQPVHLPSVEQLASGKSGFELAVSGDVWEAYQKRDLTVAAQLAKAIRIYGRCTPFHKVSVVSTFVDLGYITLMCGDGGNDCGALKTAHVGVALSDAEASLVSPFASLDKSISSVVEVLREGRCSLASALASYKYMIIYGQLEAFNNVNNAYFLINFSEYCWVFMDGFWMICMSFTLPLAKAADRLVPSQPTASLLGPITMSSACGVLSWNIFFAIMALVILHRQDWFQCRKWDNEDASNLTVIGDNYESETLFLVTGYQYISTAMAYNFGYEFRQRWLNNRVFVGLAILFTVIHFWITLVPGKISCIFRVNCENDDVVYSIANGAYVPIQNPWNTTVMPTSYRFTLLVIMLLNTAVIVAWDYFVVNGTRQRLGKKKRKQVAKSVPLESAPANQNGRMEHFEIGFIESDNGVV